MPPASSSPITSELLELLIAEHAQRDRPRLERLWKYYRNPETRGPAGERCAQIDGLPHRLTRPAVERAATTPREIVIENDIAWRIHALVDFMFGQPLVIQRLAEDAERADRLTAFLNHSFRANGGEAFFHDLALLGSVYGHVDVLVRPQPPAPHKSPPPPIKLELIEASRAIPLLNPGDYRELDAYLIHHTLQTHQVESSPFLDRVLRRNPNAQRRALQRTEVWAPETRQVYLEGGSRSGGSRRLVEEAANPLGIIPVVHIQNLPQPYFYTGLSDVEPLIPLQDELNTRLSDRANRVTFQSFKMYLGKGIDGFTDRPVGSGQMWSTDNPDAAMNRADLDERRLMEAARVLTLAEHWIGRVLPGLTL